LEKTRSRFRAKLAVPDSEEGNWSMDDEMFVFRKEITDN
jgi:hypothetical protein